mmetsp:Transcript_100638/g.300266  ORF Transcript_100638/g.300266 Transcript_100638/m.300266 type:complete len:225 (+) Transcript_100638:152-826(+)
MGGQMPTEVRSSSYQRPLTLSLGAEDSSAGPELRHQPVHQDTDLVHGEAALLLDGGLHAVRVDVRQVAPEEGQAVHELHNVAAAQLAVPISVDPVEEEESGVQRVELDVPLKALESEPRHVHVSLALVVERVEQPLYLGQVADPVVELPDQSLLLPVSDVVGFVLGLQRAHLPLQLLVEGIVVVNLLAERPQQVDGLAQPGEVDAHRYENHAYDESKCVDLLPP